MNDEELAALLAVVMPGRTIDGLRKDERQEMCIKWSDLADFSFKSLDICRVWDQATKYRICVPKPFSLVYPFKSFLSWLLLS